jgi:hypothetical protein
MTKMLSSLGLAIVLAVSVTGCELYFGDHNSNDNWSYCGSDGYYTCTGDNCTWASATCPQGGGSGFSCTTNTDCAAGCFCQDGTCQEAGFCGDTQQCPDGFHCDARSSCVPDTCSMDSDCLAGQACVGGMCTTTCVCSNDREAIAGGFGYCDEARSTCMPGTDPAGSCVGAVTCNTTAPTCAAGEVALIKDGCYTGSCRAIAQCDLAPTCAAITHETDCLARTADCTAVYIGHNCTNNMGQSCTSGSANCTCETFTFGACEAK